jgi:hypothetical protein
MALDHGPDSDLDRRIGASGSGKGPHGPYGRKTQKGTVSGALLNGAGDEIRTHDPNLGKVMLYP